MEEEPGNGQTEQHAETLRDLTRNGGPIDAQGNHASQRNAKWFDQQTDRPLRARNRSNRQLLEEFRDENPNVPLGHKAILLAGPPGAGKTTAQTSLFESTATTSSDWRLLNADDFKDRILKRAISDGSYSTALTPPKVADIEKKGEIVWPRERAALVHEESSMLMKRARDKSIRLGENVIIDGTLSNPDGGAKLVKRLEEEGYSVQIALVDGPRDVTEARVAHRWAQGYNQAVKGDADENDPDIVTLGGRWVPPEVTATLYGDNDDNSICTNSARTIAQSSISVTQLDVYRIAEPAGKPQLIERRTGKDKDGRWKRIHKYSDKQHSNKNKQANTPKQPTSTRTERKTSLPGDSTPQCSVCGRPLRSAESIARGAGPTCAGTSHPRATKNS